MATREIRQHRRPVMNIKQEQDDDSDAEEPHLGLTFRRADGRESQIIHSGHFMVSSPHTEHPPKKGYDFDTVNKQTCQTYHFGKTSRSHLSIDASLTKLFECMSLAYSGKLVSPKWKNFKGLKLQWRDKIRLNNAIWRAWYIQYVERRENPVCRFETPLDGNIDCDIRPAAEATEVKYVKRRKEIVIREYHKWRAYFKKRLQRHKDDDLSSLLRGAEEQYSLFGDTFPDTFRMSFCQDEEMRRVSRRSHDSPVPMEMDPYMDMDMLMSEFSDTLFSTLASHQPIAWPNPREIAHAGNADMIQPGLIPLQPDFTDEPWQDLFRPPIFPFSPPALSASAQTSLPSSSSQSQAPMLPSIPLPSDLQPIGLDNRLVSSPGLPITQGLTNQSVPRDPNSAYSQNYMPLFAVQVAPSPPQPVPMGAIPPSLPCPAVSAETLLPGAGDGPPLSVITHTASSVVTPSNAATTFSQGTELPSAQIAPSPLSQSLHQPAAQRLPQTAAQALPQTLPQHLAPALTQSLPQSLPQPAAQAPLPPPGPSVQPQGVGLPPAFIQPRPVGPVSSKKSRHAQRIAPASARPSTQLIFTAPFPGHTGAVIVTPSTVKCDSVPATGVVLGSPNVARGSTYHILPQTQKSPQPIVPKEETAASTSNSKTPTPSPSAGLEGRSSGQGSPCGLEQAASPQSPLNSTVLLKNENNQSRRVNHISAEQKRRFNINNGFKTLCSLVPTLKSQSNISNAATLQKTVDYIGKLQQERQHMQEESRRLKEEIEELNASISLCQKQLPDTGVSLTQHHFNHMREKYDEYVKNRTLQNWKFWIFSVIIKPLFESFNGSVSTKSKEELCETTLQWLDRHCALPVLRPMVLGTLRQLSTTTSIIGNPSLLPEEAKQAVSKQRAAEP